MSRIVIVKLIHHRHEPVYIIYVTYAQCSLYKASRGMMDSAKLVEEQLIADEGG
jgi:hypothetical protein